MKPHNRILATKIADQLFENGVGEYAIRLVLTDEKGRDLGGWCKKAVIKAIEKHLNESSKTP